MPYINPNTRQCIDDGDAPRTAGELNYLITTLCEGYREANGDFYGTFNDIIGVLECAKLEYYRRVVKVYENQKRKESGDVYAAVTP